MKVYYAQVSDLLIETMDVAEFGQQFVTTADGRQLPKDSDQMIIRKTFAAARSALVAYYALQAQRALVNVQNALECLDQAQQLEKYSGYKLNLRTRKITPIRFNVVEFGHDDMLLDDMTTRPQRTATAIYCETRAQAETELANLPHVTAVAE